MSRLAQLAAEDSSILQRLGASNSPASRLSASSNQTSDLRPLRPSSASDSPPQSSENLNQNVPTEIQQAVAEAVAATADLTQVSPELLRYLNLNPLALEMSLRDLQAQPQTPSTQVTIELTERLWHVANAMAEERATFLRVQQQQEQEKRRLFTLQAEQEALLERLRSVQAGTSNDPVLVTSSSSSSPPASRLRQPTPSLVLRHLRSVANPPPSFTIQPTSSLSQLSHPPATVATEGGDLLLQQQSTLQQQATLPLTLEQQDRLRHQQLQDLIHGLQGSDQPVRKESLAPKTATLQPAQVVASPSQKHVDLMARIQQNRQAIQAATQKLTAERQRNAPSQQPAPHPAVKRPSQSTSRTKAPSSRVTADAQDEAIIRDAQRRLAKRATSTQPTTTRQRPTTPSRAEERRIAVLTGDKELLRHGSDRTKGDVRSEDELEDVLAEAKAFKAAQHLFHPKTTNLYTRDGYVDSAFISDSVDRGHEEEGDPDDNHDDDPSSDYQQTPGSTPSPSRKISESEWRQFQAFKKQQQASVPPAAPSVAPAPAAPAVDPQGRVPNYNIVVAEPPRHGTWNDVKYLMKDFKDNHERYVARCGEASHLSVWECYTPSAQQSIVKHLKVQDKRKPDATTRDAAYLAKLTDDELYSLLQNELGLSYPTEVEQQLKLITFRGSVLEIPNWINFHTDWTDLLARVTTAGQLPARRMSEIFRDAIPDPFIHDWLKGRKDATWEEAYEAMMDAFNDNKWLLLYNKDSKARSTPARQRSQRFNSAATPNQADDDHPPAHAGGGAQTGAAQSGARKPFNPLEWRNKRGQLNVNPNMKLDVNDNPQGKTCRRCKDPKPHRYSDDLCTAVFDANKQKIEPPLTAEEHHACLLKRWNRGFFFAKPLESYKSPSAAQSANDAQAAKERLQRP